MTETNSRFCTPHTKQKGESKCIRNSSRVIWSSRDKWHEWHSNRDIDGSAETRNPSVWRESVERAIKCAAKKSGWDYVELSEVKDSREPPPSPSERPSTPVAGARDNIGRSEGEFDQDANKSWPAKIRWGETRGDVKRNSHTGHWGVSSDEGATRLKWVLRLEGEAQTFKHGGKWGKWDYVVEEQNKTSNFGYFWLSTHLLASTVHSRGQRGVCNKSLSKSQEATRVFCLIQQIFFLYFSFHHCWWQGQKILQVCLLKPFRGAHSQQSGGAGECSLEILWLRTAATHCGHIFVKDCIQGGRRHQCHLVCREPQGSDLPAARDGSTLNTTN